MMGIAVTFILQRVSGSSTVALLHQKLVLFIYRRTQVTEISELNHSCLYTYSILFFFCCRSLNSP